VAGEKKEKEHMSETEQLIVEAAEKYRNWGKWGAEDQLGTLNYITPAKVAQAAQLARQGKVFSLALPLDTKGPQRGMLNRFNPVHVMLEDGGDWAAGSRPFANGIGGADDLVTMPLQCATHWDGLSHIFDHGKMWNGYHASEVTSRGAARNGIERAADRLISRGVLLDLPRFKGVEALDDGYAISEEDLLGCIAAQGVTSQVGSGDIVLLRTGQLGRARLNGWGTYAGGDAPGLSFWTLDWLARTQIAAIASDTWGVEVRPNELAGAFQPLHQVAIPNIGLTLGEMFVLDELASDCASDGVYEFLLIAAPLPVTGAVGAPVNPQAIK
jgi:kynurenine formamidase